MLSATLPVTVLRWDSEAPVDAETATPDPARALDRFLAGIERRAFRIARVAVRHEDDALDIVQDAMLHLARSYGGRPSAEWAPLFYRILQNRIRDYQRRRKVRTRLLGWLPGYSDDEEPGDPYDLVPDGAAAPVEQLATAEAIRTLDSALAALPLRQQQAFMLRNFEGLDVAGTALAMGCSEGTVKTHYSRAVHALRERLGDVW